MATEKRQRDVAAGRLPPEDYRRNFSDVHPPLDRHQALVEADRCYFCDDAPCMQACPTSIDIPLFIRQIATGNPKGSAETIFKSNILGGICARVCPTETLCEEVCVRNLAEEKPVKIGLLQRYATDSLIDADVQIFQRAAPSGKRVAVVGAGPAGLACAHSLARAGHEVTIYDARPKAGGLNEFGIAAYKAPENFAQREVDYILGIGGIAIETGKELGQDLSLQQLRQDFDAVFLGLGLGAVNALGLGEEAVEGVEDAVVQIAELRQAEDLASLPVGRNVVVVGGGISGLSAAHFYRRARPDARVVILTGYGNFATAVSAVKLGATDYLAKPADADQVEAALLQATADMPPPPAFPMSAERVRWEHIQRVYEQCGRNMSETARRLRMHRRTLQRILAKHAPRD